MDNNIDEQSYKDALTLIRVAHEDWVDSGGLYGKRLDFSGADLREAKLTGANLEGADISGAKGVTRSQKIGRGG